MGNEISIEDRYKLLINARNFHYENFSKWLTYFYLAIGALFIAYYNVCSSNTIKEDKRELLEFSIVLLGYISSLLWYWSSKGYYYWNINFITLVNYYEKNILKLPENERVYFVFANKKEQNNYISPIKGANISTSKIAILFAFIITTFWGFFLFTFLIKQIGCPCLTGCLIIKSLLFSIISIYLLSSFIPK